MTVKELKEQLDAYPDYYEVRSFISALCECPMSGPEKCELCNMNESSIGHEWSENFPAHIGSEIKEVKSNSDGVSVLLKTTL